MHGCGSKWHIILELPSYSNVAYPTYYSHAEYYHSSISYANSNGHTAVADNFDSLMASKNFIITEQVF